MRISAPIVLCVLASLLFASASSGWDCAPSLGIARPKLTFEDIRSERVQEGPGKQWRLYRTFVNIDNDDVAGEHPLSRLRRDGDAQLTAQHTTRQHRHQCRVPSAACRQPRSVSRPLLCIVSRRHQALSRHDCSQTYRSKASDSAASELEFRSPTDHGHMTVERWLSMRTGKRTWVPIFFTSGGKSHTSLTQVSQKSHTSLIRSCPQCDSHGCPHTSLDFGRQVLYKSHTQLSPM